MSDAVDLRSDTVTRPTPAMRRAMAEAEVGDDVFGEDPTVRRLEERAAELLGTQAALFVPSGTMGNQIALHVLGKAGTDVICETSSHVVKYEGASMAVLSGLKAQVVQGTAGVLDPAAVEQAVNQGDPFRPPTGLLALENTHNMAGGRVVTPKRTRDLAAVARRHGLPVHLDGARIFNAAVALDVPVADLVESVDTVMFCLSKGLGAPIGSMLCGPKEVIAEAHRVRSLFGGAMRQVGVVAAAGLVALEEGPKHLAEDHRRARRLGECIAQIEGLALDLEGVETNILIFRVLAPEEGPSAQDPAGGPARGFAQRLAEAGVLSVPVSRDEVRLVTHRDLSEEDVNRAVMALRSLAGAASGPSRPTPGLDGVSVREISADETRGLRRQVLRPNRPPEECVYPGDEEARTGHLGLFRGGELVGVASIFEESRPGAQEGWRIRGMAVTEGLQGKGYGSRLLTACLDHARRHGGREAWCNARTSAATFYGHQGFEAEGEEFELPGIGPHFLMRRELLREA